jgi:hypothetical protein
MIATCKVWDVSSSLSPDGMCSMMHTPLYSISPAGNVNRLRWRPSANVSDAAIKSSTHSNNSMNAATTTTTLKDPSPSHQWQLAMECRHSVIQIWDVREGFMPIAVLHPPASSVFVTGSGSGSSKDVESSKKLESVEFASFEWLDTPAPMNADKPSG